MAATLMPAFLAAMGMAASWVGLMQNSRPYLFGFTDGRTDNFVQGSPELHG
jgi:hypothetical protein